MLLAIREGGSQAVSLPRYRLSKVALEFCSNLQRSMSRYFNEKPIHLKVFGNIGGTAENSPSSN